MYNHGADCDTQKIMSVNSIQILFATQIVAKLFSNYSIRNLNLIENFLIKICE